MKRILTRVPMRADLAGGTLDLWPIYLFQERACTVNVAISYHAECEVTRIDDDHAIEVALLDLDYRQRYESFQELSNDPKTALVFRVLDHFRLTGVRVATRSDAPRGSGLGASSALSVALLSGVSEIVGQPLDSEDLIILVRDLETRLLGIPAGIQDYYPPVYGGLAALHLEAGRVVRQPLPTPLSELAASMVIHYSGVSHFSGTNNWEIYKRFLDGDEHVRTSLARIAETAGWMEDALNNHDLQLAGKLLSEEWRLRRELAGDISTPEIDRIVSIAERNGAHGAKVCGAGGGGCVVMLVEPNRREELIEQLSEAPGFTVPAAPVPYGLETSSPEDSLTSRAQASWKIRPSDPGQTIDELWMKDDGADATRPYLVADASITFDASRRGAVHTAERHYVVPIRGEADRVEWALLRPFEEGAVELVSMPPTTSPDARSVEAAVRVAHEAAAELPEQIAEQESLRLLHNASLGLLSQPEEREEDFIERCLELAREKASPEYERMESTFRLKIEQVRERYEKEHRDSVAEEDENERSESKSSAFPWGQIVHDILSGREPSTLAPSNPMESDLIAKIERHQKSWTRDLEQFHEEIRRSASDVETAEISPNASEIQLVRYVIVWAAGIDSFPPID
ncbi:MAG: hypothetical protein R3338_00945 [Thermoanaerobaculia bacterium]|nr:hypothetical protein [Thermoanaerobaculia bacterium]